ncbi:hypothetical protein [Ruminococcus sp.]|uniref:hypothetical protein n=1 Tax=Ruminococcus sp. TaxID=41978 RepID=UPI0025D7495D|nr:hypothetical protein [Ruminococcus sp.]
MKIVVTIKDFENDMSQFNFLIPSIGDSMEKLIYQLVNLDGPPIDINGLNTIHFTDNYRSELFHFQELIGNDTFSTSNKIGSGHAQVVTAKEGKAPPDVVGYHIFIDKIIPLTILVSNSTENSQEVIDKDIINQVRDTKNVYIRMIRHELAHVEDHNNQKKWNWFKEAFKSSDLQATLRYSGYRLWEEFYACKRSNFIYNIENAINELDTLNSSLETAEKEICDLRWKYNFQQISLDEFVSQLYDYIITAFIYCCYFMGHMDKIHDSIIKNLYSEQYPSRFYPFIPKIWDTLERMAEHYPNWDGPEIFDDLASIIKRSIESFEIYPNETPEGTYYKIPIRRLKTKKEEAKLI